MGGSIVNPLVGQLAPSLQLPGLDGQDHLLSEYRGPTNKTLLLHFTDPNSRSCQKAIEHLENLWKEADKREVIVITIVKGSGAGAMTSAQAFRQKNDLNFPILVDDQAQAASAFAVKAYPTTVIIDAGGKVAFVQSGGFNGGSIDTVLRREKRWF
jgi:peroxiredoxin